MQSQRKCKEDRITAFYNLILTRTSYLCCILFIRNKSLVLAHTHGEGITQRARGRGLWQSCQKLLTRHTPGPANPRHAKHWVLILPMTALPHSVPMTSFHVLLVFKSLLQWLHGERDANTSWRLNEWVSLHCEDLYKDGWNPLDLLNGKSYRGFSTLTAHMSSLRFSCSAKSHTKNNETCGKNRDSTDSTKPMKIHNPNTYKKYWQLQVYTLR